MMADYKEGSAFNRVPTLNFDDQGPKRWQTRPEVIEGFVLTEGNIDRVARWCGGEQVSEQTHDEGTIMCLLVPRLGVGLKARPGDYVVRNTSTGKFDVITAGDFAAKGFYDVGLLDEVHFHRGGSIQPIPDVYTKNGVTEPHGSPRYLGAPSGEPDQRAGRA